MTQQRPSEPSDRHVEYVAADAEPPGRPAASGTGPTAHGNIPHQQSLPGPDDDVLLATGRPRRPASTREGETLIDSERRRQEKIRRQPGRRAWTPNQHGAWPMTVLPIVIGAALGGPTWEHLVLGFAWTTAFACFNAVEHWVKSPKRRKSAIIRAVVASGAVAAASGGAYLAFRPALAWWAVGFVPLVGVALWEVRAGRERSILARLATIAASSLMLPVAFSVSASGGFPGSVPARVWVAAGVLGAQFAGTVPTVRSMVRGRGDRRWVIGSVLFHALCTAAAVGLAAAGLISAWAVPVWVAMTVRAWAMPAWSERRARPLAPKTIGPLEFVWVGLLAIALVLP